MRQIARKFLRLTALSALCLAVRTSAGAQRIDFSIPPAKYDITSIGMGDANVADGKNFYAAGYNPALLQKAPRKYELLGFGFEMTSDLLSTYNYLKGSKDSFRDIYKNLKQGVATSNINQVSQGLDAVQSIVDRVGNKPYGVTGGPYASARIGDHFGLQVYNNTNALVEASPGDLTNSLLAIPRPLTVGSLSGPALTNALNVLGTDIQNGINAVVPASVQTSLQNEINAFLGGTNTIDTFLANVSTMAATIDINALKQAIVNNIQGDLASILVVGYSDTVMMGTYAYDPMPVLLPNLTIGTNLKLVNRRVTVRALAPQDIKGNITGKILKDLNRSSTRFGADLGFLYDLQRWDMNFGLMLEDLIRNRVTQQGNSENLVDLFITDPGPLNMRAGVSWRPFSKLTVNADFDDMLNNTLIYSNGNGISRLKFGGRYNLLSWLQLRAGIGNQQLTSGIGFLFHYFGFDYAYARDSFTQRFSHFAQFRFLL